MLKPTYIRIDEKKKKKKKKLKEAYCVGIIHALHYLLENKGLFLSRNFDSEIPHNLPVLHFRLLSEIAII